MGLFFGGRCGELDDQMGFVQQLLQQLCRLVAVRAVTFKQLVGRQHHLVRGFAAPAAPAHPIGHHAQQAPGHPGVGQQAELVLLVVPVAAIEAGGR